MAMAIVQEESPEPTSVWHYRDHLEELSCATLTLREFLLLLHRGQRQSKTVTQRKKGRKQAKQCSDASECLNGEHQQKQNESDSGFISPASNEDEIVPKPTDKVKRKPLSWREKQKLDRELIRKKLSMTDPDEDDANEKPWQQPRFERSYSSSNQSLQICYINESCSSDENENSSNGDKTQSSDLKFSSTSPTASPYVTSPRVYGRGYMRPHRLSDASSPTSSLSSLSTISQFTGSESTIIHHHSHSDLRNGRTKQEELELEARYQLAQAHQKAKAQAEEDRQKNKLTKNSSIVHKLLSVSLNDDTNAKIKSFALTAHDCKQMTLGQVQLILNDMHTKKQALNDALVNLLVERDELKTRQDAKLVDIEDMKAILNSLGPETTV